MSDILTKSAILWNRTQFIKNVSSVFLNLTFRGLATWQEDAGERRQTLITKWSTLVRTGLNFNQKRKHLIFFPIIKGDYFILRTHNNQELIVFI